MGRRSKRRLGPGHEPSSPGAATCKLLDSHSHDRDSPGAHERKLLGARHRAFEGATPYEKVRALPELSKTWQASAGKTSVTSCPIRWRESPAARTVRINRSAVRT